MTWQPQGSIVAQLPQPPEKEEGLLEWSRAITKALSESHLDTKRSEDIRIVHGEHDERPDATGSRRLWYSQNKSIMYYDDGNWQGVGGSGMSPPHPDPHLLGNGSAGAPTYSFANDPDTGVFLGGVGIIDVSVGGTARLGIGTASAEWTVPVYFPNGIAGAPSISFATDVDTGVFLSGAGVLGLSAAGTTRATISSTLATFAVPVAVPSGDANNPGLLFASDADTGVFLSGANAFDISAGGVSRLSISPSFVAASVPFRAPVGAVGGPTFTFLNDENTGIFHPFTKQIGFTCDGTELARIAGGGLSIGYGAAPPDGCKLYVYAGTGSCSAGVDVAQAAAEASFIVNRAGTGGKASFLLASGGSAAWYMTLRDATSNLAFTTALGGAADLVIEPLTGISIYGYARAGAGSVGAPAFSFYQDTDTGMRNSGADTLAFVCGGSDMLSISGSGVFLPDAGALFALDQDTGIYRIGSDNLGIKCGGSAMLSVSGSGVFLPDAGGLFISDPDTGIYRIGSDNLGIKCGGAQAASFTASYIKSAGAMWLYGTVNTGLSGSSTYVDVLAGGDTCARFISSRLHIVTPNQWPPALYTGCTTMYLDESNDKLCFAVKYSTGTEKVGHIDLT